MAEVARVRRCVVKVLLLLDSLAPGGTETSSVLLAPAMKSLGVETIVATLATAQPDLTGAARDAGIRVIPLEAASAVARVRAVRRLLRNERPDLLHTALFRADQVGRWAAVGTGVPVLASFVNTPYVPERMRDPNVSQWKLRVLQAVDSVTGRLLVDSFHAVSDGVRDENVRALRLPMSRVRVVERGRDLAAFGSRTEARRRAARADLGIAESVPVLLNIGRQEYQKGQLDLIRASELLGSRDLSHLVLIAGKPGNASAALQRALSDPANAAARVRFVGHRSDIAELLCAADVVVISSLFEGTAGAALEAMAMGVPIVSTDLPGTRGILRHGANALVVPIGDSEQLARAIDTVLRDGELAQSIAEKGRSDFFQRFTLERSAASMAELYRAVVSGRRSSHP
jgi:glycosyltransferase involved in cell wall biosynthesis